MQWQLRWGYTFKCLILLSFFKVNVLPLLFWLCGMRLYLLLFRLYRKWTLCKCLVKMIFCLQVNVVILSYLTNILVDSLGEDSNEGDLNQIFLELFTHNDSLFSFCQSFPTVRVFLSPPNVRLKPTWFSWLRPSIIRVLHRFLQSRPPNLQILDDFAGDVDKDGVHYSILSGINFVKSITDQAVELVKTACPDPSVR